MPIPLLHNSPEKTSYQESHTPCDDSENQDFSVVGSSDFHVHMNQPGLLLKMQILIRGGGRLRVCISNKLPYDVRPPGCGPYSE